MVSGETAMLAAAGGLAAAEVTGVTNIVPGVGSGGRSGRDGSPTSLPAELLSALQSTGSGLPPGILQAISNAGVGDDVLREVVEQASSGVPHDLAETIAAESGGYDAGTVQSLLDQQAQSFESVVESTTSTDVPTSDDVAGEVVDRLGGPTGLLDAPGDLGDDGDGGNTNFGGDYDLARYGFADPIRATAEVGKEGAQGAGAVDSFLRENPYVATGTGIGAISPDPITTGLGFAAGSVAEVSADTLTGGTPLGVRSPIDVTGGGAWWQGPAPLEGTSGVQDTQDAVQQFAGTTAVPTAAAGAAVDAVTPDGPILGGGGNGSQSQNPNMRGRDEVVNEETSGSADTEGGVDLRSGFPTADRQGGVDLSTGFSTDDTGGGGSGASSPTDDKDREKDREVPTQPLSGHVPAPSGVRPA